jgi:hypothetical protein
MDHKKFETLIDLIINENEEQARALFHDIVVEKSREIYEDIMSDEMDEGMDPGGQVGQMMDEISAEEEGMTEEEDEEIDFDDEGDEDIIDIEADGEMDHSEEGEEDRLVSIEDKLDQLMAEFEQIMGNGDDDMDMGDDEMADADDEMAMGDEEMAMGDEEEAMMEAITLKKVSVTHGDNGQNTKSTSLQNSGQAGMDSRPVKFSGASEAVPTSPKGPSNFYSKGEGQVKDANNWKNAPAQNNADLEKAPAPSKSQASGTNTKSPVAESRKPVKRIIK